MCLLEMSGGKGCEGLSGGEDGVCLMEIWICDKPNTIIKSKRYKEQDWTETC